MSTVEELVDVFMNVGEEQAIIMLSHYEEKLYEALQENKKLDTNGFVINHWKEMIDELTKRLFGITQTQ